MFPIFLPFLIQIEAIDSWTLGPSLEPGVVVEGVEVWALDRGRDGRTIGGGEAGVAEQG
jgi:hypothetical protein